jgi:hypothetical protein
MLCTLPTSLEVETTKVYIGGAVLRGLRCPELCTSIISLTCAHLVRKIPGTVQRSGITLSSGVVDVKLLDRSDMVTIQVELAALKNYDILIGNDLM